jgi:N utilization substance protein B
MSSKSHLRHISLRHRSREIALQLIYQLDIRPSANVEEVIELYFTEDDAKNSDEVIVLYPSVDEVENIHELTELYLSEDEAEEVFDYACELVKGVCDNIDAISDLLRENIIGWRPERMVAVDKVAISIALYEGIISKKVPVAVSISEAVVLAKIFGTAESGRFVNGVLGRIVRKEEPPLN